MTEPRPIVISASNPDGDRLTVACPRDAGVEDLAHTFRTIAFWLTFVPDDVVPDGMRNWIYTDEKEG